jgi:acetyl esterase/lipase
VAFDTSKLGTQELDVTYDTVDGVELKLDVYYPTGGPGSDGPWPALIWAHGGAWTEGDKAPLPVNAAAAGFLVASVNYRLYPAYRFPAMIQDLKCAIRYLRAHAAAYNLDPARISLIGHSAGGHLAALAGMAEESAGWDVGPYRHQSSGVQAVVAMSAPADLTARYPDWVEAIKVAVFGPEGLDGASPIRHVRSDAPPFLIVHGAADPLIPVTQAYLLHDSLRKAGVPSELLIIESAGHGFEPMGGTPAPSMEQVLAEMLTFLSGMVDPPVQE